MSKDMFICWRWHPAAEEGTSYKLPRKVRKGICYSCPHKYPHDICSCSQTIMVKCADPGADQPAEDCHWIDVEN